MHVTRSFGVIIVLTVMSLGAEGINHWNIGNIKGIERRTTWP